VRQLNDHKGSIDMADLAGTGLEAYAEVCGELLARGHARSGDPLVLAGYHRRRRRLWPKLLQVWFLYADRPKGLAATPAAPAKIQPNSENVSQTGKIRSLFGFSAQKTCGPDKEKPHARMNLSVAMEFVLPLRQMRMHEPLLQ